MRRHAAITSALLTGLFVGLSSIEAGATAPTSERFTVSATKQIPTNLPADLPGRTSGGAAVEPIDFPTETPAEPVESLTEQATPRSPVEAPAQSTPAPRSVAAWRLFTSDVGRFRVAMPSPPATYTFAPGLNATDSRMYMQMQLVNTTQLEIYAAAFIESPDFAVADENLDLALRSCVENISDRPIESEPIPITLGSYRGMEAEFENETGRQISRCYLVGDRAYMLTATSEPFDAGGGLIPIESAPTADEPTEERSAAMEAFFDSFEILD